MQTATYWSIPLFTPSHSTSHHLTHYTISLFIVSIVCLSSHQNGSSRRDRVLSVWCIEECPASRMYYLAHVGHLISVCWNKKSFCSVDQSNDFLHLCKCGLSGRGRGRNAATCKGNLGLSVRQWKPTPPPQAGSWDRSPRLWCNCWSDSGHLEGGLLDPSLVLDSTLSLDSRAQWWRARIS